MAIRIGDWFQGNLSDSLWFQGDWLACLRSFHSTHWSFFWSSRRSPRESQCQCCLTNYPKYSYLIRFLISLLRLLQLLVLWPISWWYAQYKFSFLLFFSIILRAGQSKFYYSMTVKIWDQVAFKGVRSFSEIGSLSLLIRSKTLWESHHNPSKVFGTFLPRFAFYFRSRRSMQLLVLIDWSHPRWTYWFFPKSHPMLMDSFGKTPYWMLWSKPMDNDGRGDLSLKVKNLYAFLCKIG